MDAPPRTSDDPRDIRLSRCVFDDIKLGKYYYVKSTWHEGDDFVTMWDRMHVLHKDPGAVAGDALALVNRGIRSDPTIPERVLMTNRDEVTAEVPAVSGSPRVVCHFYIPTPPPNFVATVTSKPPPRGNTKRSRRNNSRSRSRRTNRSRKNRRKY